MSTWIINGPYGARTAVSWPAAFELLCQDIRTTWRLDGRMGERAAELQTWAEVEHLQPGAPCKITVFGKAHRIERVP